ncbi:hypothetical protein [Sphingomonas alpina]|uniref:Uncharacterized protein n=1 Tax=Sphingomonas alpina TaxID=653931 RepID=A0A7H0LKJ0_9SPHN|nr:hypothetical protein [Sphingomonas alpina]QNQ10193.1 hypothetical protein H3Z74_02810 [Sphingomonas alpina]
MAAQKILFHTAIAALGSTLPAPAIAAQNDLVVGATVVSPCAISVTPVKKRQPSDTKSISIDCVSSTQTFVVLDDLAKASPRADAQRGSSSEPQDIADDGVVEVVKIIF